ncbi:hypothetical protein [Paenibacillus sp. ISL-20]|uniref:hypothetical protein n=1 Tax=Paenibacillus sp. ISL-20 TaxID=2819163 RepID=UPI001BE5A662|nr:hypothetical protein [Paenibacillus sp. ISL-20]MBT2761812.1 hypothetical protein [Paenibacillus sp. ISL-20]
MEYIYESAQRSYEDFASGRVLYNAQGTTSFPVRLASEIAQRCFQLLEKKGVQEPYTLFDPCCGGAYLLTVVGLLHGQRIHRVIGSDINAEVLGIAGKNLSLLREEGLEQRTEQLKELLALYHKPSHQDALQSAGRLRELLRSSRVEETVCFQADITQLEESLASCKGTHIVMTDLPYGDLVSWGGGSNEPVEDFFNGIHSILNPSCSVVAVISDKGQKLKHDRFQRIQHAKVGKRQVAIFEPL